MAHYRATRAKYFKGAAHHVEILEMSRSPYRHYFKRVAHHVEINQPHQKFMTTVNLVSESLEIDLLSNAKKESVFEHPTYLSVPVI